MVSEEGQWRQIKLFAAASVNWMQYSFNKNASFMELLRVSVCPSALIDSQRIKCINR